MRFWPMHPLSRARGIGRGNVTGTDSRTTCECFTMRTGPLRIAAAWAGEMGESAAATRAATLIDQLSPNYLAMCGICAGKRGDTFLGDVIVADRVFSYDHGKLVVEAAKSLGSSATSRPTTSRSNG